jgi:hypothetical protein
MTYINFKTSKRKTVVAICATAAIIGLTSLSATAATNCKAGVAPFLSGQKGIVINHSGMDNYVAVVQATNTAGYSSQSTPTYFNVLKLKPTNFQVQHKRTDNGTPIALDTNVSLAWIICQK